MTKNRSSAHLERGLAVSTVYPEDSIVAHMFQCCVIEGIGDCPVTEMGRGNQTIELVCEEEIWRRCAVGGIVPPECLQRGVESGRAEQRER